MKMILKFVQRPPKEIEVPDGYFDECMDDTFSIWPSAYKRKHFDKKYGFHTVRIFYCEADELTNLLSNNSYPNETNFYLDGDFVTNTALIVCWDQGKPSEMSPRLAKKIKRDTRYLLPREYVREIYRLVKTKKDPSYLKCVESYPLKKLSTY